MTWVILFLIALMLLSTLCAYYFLATKKYRHCSEQKLSKVRLVMMSMAMIGFLLGSYILHHLLKYFEPAFWLQALSTLLMLLVASTSIYHGKHWLLPTLSAALMTLSSASYYASARLGLDMPFEFAIAMGVAVSSLFTAILLFFGSQQQAPDE
jgi:hypothetical protein